MAVMVLNLSHIAPVGVEDLNRNTSSPKYKPGGMAWMEDAFGMRLFRYGQNRSGATQAQSTLASRVGNADATTVIDNITSGTTTSATKVGGWTANIHVGSMCYVFDNADAAGAAPEGEVSITIANTTDRVDVDPDMPYSVALAANDDLRMIGTWNLENAADGDKAYTVFGVVVGNDGVSNNNFGFYQSWGVCPQVLIKAGAPLALGEAVVADDGRVGPSAGSTDPANLHIGVAIAQVSSDIVSDKAPVFLTLDVGVSVGTVDASA
jgi:hypothetical protein